MRGVGTPHTFIGKKAYQICLTTVLTYGSLLAGTIGLTEVFQKSGVEFEPVTIGDVSICPGLKCQRALFHFASWDFDSEAASHISFESALKQLYLDWFTKYHVEAKLCKATAAVA